MIKNIKWTFVSSVIAAVSQTLLLFMLAALGGSNEVGLYSLSFLLLSFGMIFSEFGLTQFYIQQNVYQPNKRSSLFLLGLVYAVIPFTFLNLSSWFTANQTLVDCLQITSLAILASNITLLQQADLIRQKKFKLLALVEIGWRLAQLMIAVPVLIFYSASAEMLLSLLVAAYCIRALLLLFVCKISFSGYPKKALIVAAFKYGYPLTLSNFVSLFKGQIDQLVISYALGISQLGIYSIAKELISSVHKLSNSVITRISFPILCQSEMAAKIQLANYIVKVSSWVNFISHFAIYSVLYLALVMLEIATYNDSLKVYLLLSLFAVIRPVGVVNSLIAQSLAKTTVELKWNTLTIISILPVAIVALLTKDILLVAATVSVTQLVLTLVSFTFFDHALSIKSAVYRYKIIVYPLTLTLMLALACLTII